MKLLPFLFEAVEENLVKHTYDRIKDVILELDPPIVTSDNENLVVNTATELVGILGNGEARIHVTDFVNPRHIRVEVEMNDQLIARETLSVEIHRTSDGLPIEDYTEYSQSRLEKIFSEIRNFSSSGDSIKEHFEDIFSDSRNKLLQFGESTIGKPILSYEITRLGGSYSAEGESTLVSLTNPGKTAEVSLFLRFDKAEEIWIIWFSADFYLLDGEQNRDRVNAMEMDSFAKSEEAAKRFISKHLIAEVGKFLSSDDWQTTNTEVQPT